MAALPAAQPFEVAVARKLQERSSSLHDTFLLLDVNGDGYITRSDLKTSLHNVLGVDLTSSQMDAIFVRFAYFDETMLVDDGGDDDNQSLRKGRHTVQRSPSKHHGIRYSDFMDYIYSTAQELRVSSAEYGAHRNLHHAVGESGVNSRAKLDSVAPPTDAVTDELRLALLRKIRSHTSKSRGGGKGKATQLFLKMDSDRDGRVSPFEFMDWLAGVGLLVSDQQFKTLLGEHYNPEGISLLEFIEVMDEMEGMNSKPMPWEVIDDDEIRRRRVSAKAVMDTASRQLVDAIHLCADDAKSDQVIITAIAEQVFSTHTSLMKAFAKYDKDGSGGLDVEEFQAALRDANMFISEERAKSLVTKFDTNRDGKLGKSEFVRLITTNTVVDEPQVEETLPPVPQDNSNETATTRRKRDSIIRSLTGHEDESQHKEIAEKLDSDDVEVLTTFREAIEAEAMVARRMFQKMYKDHDKCLSPDELRAGFKSLGIELSPHHLSHIMSRFDPDGTGKLKFYQFIKLLSCNIVPDE